VGNALEVAEALDTLEGHGPPELTEFATELATLTVELASDGALERADVDDALRSGRGTRVFRQMVEAQGGDARAFEDRAHLPRARMQRVVAAESSGYLARLDALTVARASTALGAGRERKGEAIDLSVGIVLQAKVGDRVMRGQPLATLQANDATRAEHAEQLLRSAVAISPDEAAPTPLVLDRISG
jgi:pyrimidine-nucleoside phosphorylase